MDVWSRLSVVLITLNEEANLSRTLASLPKGVRLFVLDSGSLDKTRSVAERFGATFSFRPFDTYAQQKNAALALADTPWILSLDADEAWGPGLEEAISRILIADPEGKKPTAFKIRRRLVFLGRELRFGKSADQPTRLFTRGSGQFSGDIHESFQPNGMSTEVLAGGYLQHYSYADLTDYFQRFNRYTSKIAENHARSGRKVPFLGHVLRPWAEFASRYFFRLGFLDGYPGYTYALISSLYTFIKYAKLLEQLDPKGDHGQTVNNRLASHLKSLE